MRKQRKIIVVLWVLLIIAVGYILINAYSNHKQEKNLDIYQQGAQYGYEQAILQVAQQISTCQQVPLTIGEQTINVIAVECLQ